MTPINRARLVAELKDRRAQSEAVLYGPGPRLSRSERRRARLIEAELGRRPVSTNRIDRPRMVAQSMRARVRGHGINRPRGVLRELRAAALRNSYLEHANNATPEELQRESYLRRGRIASNRVLMRRNALRRNRMGSP